MTPEILALDLKPLGPLFFRDGRPFGEAGQARSTWPLPQVLAGALRAALLEASGCDLAKLRASMENCTFEQALKGKGMPKEGPAIAETSFSGPWPTFNNEVLASMPLDLYGVEGDDKIYRKRPLQDRLPGWAAPADVPGLLPLWHRGKQVLKPLRGWLKPAGLQLWVNGGVPKKEHVVADSELWSIETRTGIAVDSATQTADEGKIFSVGFMRLEQGVGLYAEAHGPVDSLALLKKAFTVVLGGEGGRVVAQARDRHTWATPAKGNYTTALLLAPAVLAQGWHPGLPNLKAAAVGSAKGFSGWDMARGGPKPSRWAAPAGSIFYFEPSTTFPADSLAQAPEDRMLGWGTLLLGACDHA